MWTFCSFSWWLYVDYCVDSYHVYMYDSWDIFLISISRAVAFTFDDYCFPWSISISTFMYCTYIYVEHTLSALFIDKYCFFLLFSLLTSQRRKLINRRRRAQSFMSSTFYDYYRQFSSYFQLIDVTGILLLSIFFFGFGCLDLFVLLFFLDSWSAN